MFCLSNCSKQGLCLSSPPVTLSLGKDHPLQTGSLPQEAHMGSGQEGAPSNHPVGSCYFHMPVNSSIWVYALRPTDFGSPKAETVFPHLD